MEDFGYPPQFPPEEEEVVEKSDGIEMKDKTKGKKVIICFNAIVLVVTNTLYFLFSYKLHLENKFNSVVL